MDKHYIDMEEGEREEFNRYLLTMRKFGVREIFVSDEKLGLKRDKKEEKCVEDDTTGLNTTSGLEDRKYEQLDKLKSEVENCRMCELGSKRKNAVFGESSYDAKLLFVGEAPGADEDAQGRPFVGRAGKLLDRLFNVLNIDRKSVFITNLLKCRPPGNRDPQEDEIKTCTPYLIRQIELIDPVVIIALGAYPARFFTGSKEGITKLRGKEYRWRNWIVIPTYHPAACLRNPNLKKPLWEDVKSALELVKR
ncbi:MAG TPA: uracil-DNA glycosylase [Firmicutes bacterium]|nr:MAG: uracil-DNA glycosylase [Candidatus Coatesbacteria bacterium]RLC44013.1 MAG: uracil-DNA glycosylase [Candidatus Coatesbacteria bacterium]HDM42896.1 uracil-DNA glycosylase [Bacillota bacterium]